MEDIEQSYNRINTGNLVIDAFVSNHMSIAEKENIEFRTDIQVSLSTFKSMIMTLVSFWAVC